MKQPTAYAMFRDGEYYDAIHPDEYDKTAGEYDIPLYTHPAKELHLSLQKVKDTGELLAVTYTDDEHRIVEVLWQKPPAKTLTYEEIDIETTRALNDLNGSDYQLIDVAQLIAKYLMQAILRKAQEK